MLGQDMLGFLPIEVETPLGRAGHRQASTGVPLLRYRASNKLTSDHAKTPTNPLRFSVRRRCCRLEEKFLEIPYSDLASAIPPHPRRTATLCRWECPPEGA